MYPDLYNRAMLLAREASAAGDLQEAKDHAYRAWTLAARYGDLDRVDRAADTYKVLVNAACWMCRGVGRRRIGEGPETHTCWACGGSGQTTRTAWPSGANPETPDGPDPSGGRADPLSPAAPRREGRRTRGRVP